MSLDEILLRVERDWESNDLGKARDRLHTLVFCYPDNLELRKMLGDVYWALRQPAMAGRYWYLEKNKSDDMAAACRAFERACGNIALDMLRALKFRGEVEPIRERFTGRTLLALQERAKRESGCHISFGKQARVQTSERLDWFGKSLVIIILVGMVTLMLIGACTLVRGVLSQL